MIAEATIEWYWPLVALVAVPILIALNAFFVAAEFALVAIRRTRVQELISQKRTGARRLLQAIDNLNDSVAASQLGITLASLALGLVSEPALAKLLQPLMRSLPAAWEGTAAHALSVTLTLFMVTYLHVVFGEQMPKIAALQSTEKIALLVAPPLNAFARISRPLTRLMNGSSNVFLRFFGFHPAIDDGEVHTVAELRLLIADTEEAGLLDEEQADIVQNVFQLSDKTVRDCMVPWEKMDALDISMTPDEIMMKVRNSAHTRMPVFDGSPDNVVGIVNTKHLFYLFNSPAELLALVRMGGAALLDEALYPATYLKPDESIANALKLFKKSRKHLAMVRDTDDHIAGMVTLEDVLEEIVGEMEDEHDRPVTLLRRWVRRPTARR